MQIQQIGFTAENAEPVPDMYCPGCGAHSVIKTLSEDYYVGATHFCLTCKCNFTIQGPDTDVAWESV